VHRAVEAEHCRAGARLALGRPGMSAAHQRRSGGLVARCDLCHAAGLALTTYACGAFTLLFIARGRALLIEDVGGGVTRHQAAPGDGAVAAFCSGGGWAACPACAALIDAGDAPGLGRRMLARQVGPSLPSGHRRAIERQILATLRGFWRHRPCPN
jgi:hypothetical protein